MPGLEDPNAIIARLRPVPLFSKLSKKQMNTLAGTATDRSYPPGDTIVKEGETKTGFFLITGGKVAIEKGGRQVATLAAGQYFGEMSLIDEMPRSATVKALEPTRCLVVFPWEFWSSVGNDPDAIRSLFRETVRRLRETPSGPSE